MAREMNRVVVDVSVVVKWFTQEDYRGQAVALRDAHIQGMIMLVAPDLLVYEVSNALRYNPALTAEDLKQVVAVI